ncbi:hypothetical protein [Streptomyces sp. NBC_00239]|uniref:hypothetical protein n=1 Tax=Streptomyces sp. NBC_00239 TaxID=2903640 RepID=UPI002E295A2F|nr:hypothetical protein [Streptomyces sp. NBC_00239]
MRREDWFGMAALSLPCLPVLLLIVAFALPGAAATPRKRALRLLGALAMTVALGVALVLLAKAAGDCLRDPICEGPSGP